MIRLENISKYYYAANAVAPALRRINLEFHTGEFVAITGESGSGKSTLLNIISGMETYDDGELYVEGQETSYYDEHDWEEYRKNKIGFVFQNYNLIDNYSSLYNVESALLIQGYGNQEAARHARQLLERVGLGNKIHQRASSLSSGQKQRLSIARALAKNTDIIVADEPTGNLDSETGKQIMELFAELSKDRLIIVVTHNYEEAKPYVTRKIRLHDGEVAADEPVSQGGYGGQPEAEKQTEATERMDTLHQDDQRKRSGRRIAWRFTLMNILTQPRRALFFFIFLLITAAVSYIFLGEIYSNRDDVFVKKYDANVFCNYDTTRIVVKKEDSGEITKEDIEKFNSIKYVRMTDQYGFANDINYYLEEGTDYDYKYTASNSVDTYEDGKTVEFLNTTHFVKSSTCITEEDLSAGTLPVKRNDIVIWSEDEAVLGKEKLCYFTGRNIWGSSQYYSAVCKVVGILKKKTEQVYFSEELCNMLSIDLYGDTCYLNVNWDLFQGHYTDGFSFIPVISDEMEYTPEAVQLKPSANMIMANGLPPGGEAELNIYYHGSSNGDNPEEAVMKVNLSDFNDFSPKFVEMNEKLFYQLFSYKSRQACVYIRDYINTDYVLKRLTRMGYIAISSYRISSVVYDQEKVGARNAIVIKALLVLLVTAVLEIVLMRSVFQMQRKNYILLKFLGMNHRIIRRMNYYEMLIYTGASVILVPAVAGIIGRLGFIYLANLVKYYNLATGFIYILFNLLIVSLTVWSFSRYLERKQKWS
jgi:ABC-type lipoprotein export system ATPase subunit